MVFMVAFNMLGGNILRLHSINAEVGNAHQWAQELRNSFGRFNATTSQLTSLYDLYDPSQWNPGSWSLTSDETVDTDKDETMKMDQDLKHRTDIPKLQSSETASVPTDGIISKTQKLKPTHNSVAAENMKHVAHSNPVAVKKPPRVSSKSSSPPAAPPALRATEKKKLGLQSRHLLPDVPRLRAFRTAPSQSARGKADNRTCILFYHIPKVIPDFLSLPHSNQLKSPTFDFSTQIAHSLLFLPFFLSSPFPTPRPLFSLGLSGLPVYLYCVMCMP
jgi:hypothetical protein